ncbi:MAG: signal peptidase II [Lachnospiraceae bacterium]|nr:signal peptidase II [Lachnospiraceae bacterium]
MIYSAITGLIFIVEFVIKFFVEKLADEKVRIPIFDGKMYLTKYHNEGAFLNFGEGKRVAVKYVSLVLTAGCLLVFVFTLGRRGKHLLKLGLSMMLGGAFSNTYDRMVRQYVVDYVGFNVPNQKFANTIFNISDFFIMIGAALSVIQMPPEKKKKKK